MQYHKNFMVLIMNFVPFGHGIKQLCAYIHVCKYSRTSVARTLMARLPWLFRTCAGVHRKGCRFGIISVIFFVILKNGILCVSLESPQ